MINRSTVKRQIKQRNECLPHTVIVGDSVILFCTPKLMGRVRRDLSSISRSLQNSSTVFCCACCVIELLCCFALVLMCCCVAVLLCFCVAVLCCCYAVTLLSCYAVVSMGGWAVGLWSLLLLLAVQ